MPEWALNLRTWNYAQKVTSRFWQELGKGVCWMDNRDKLHKRYIVCMTNEGPVADGTMIALQGKCTRSRVPSVTRKLKFRSSPMVPDRFTAGIATRNTDPRGIERRMLCWKRKQHSSFFLFSEFFFSLLSEREKTCFLVQIHPNSNVKMKGKRPWDERRKVFLSGSESSFCQ